MSRTPLRIVALWAALTAPAAVGGCASTSRVDDAAVSPGALADEQKAVAVMRIGAASPSCRHVAVLLGTPEGSGYRRHSVLQVMNVHSLAEPAVAEASLPAGRYHVIGYSCHDGKKPAVVAQQADPGLYATSYAAFSVQAGEVINVGYLNFHATHEGASAFGRPVRATITVSDWPLADIDRFKQRRPHLYARMKTRLMTVAMPAVPEESARDCARYAALRADGKVQTVPAACQSTAARR